MKNPTADEVFAATYLYFCGEIDETELEKRLGKPRKNPHGEVVERRMEAYHDVVVYEDGYEERYYIGD